MNYRHYALALITCLAPGLGCDLDQGCTDIAVGSLSLQIVDAQTQQPVPDSMITFTVDGEEVREPDHGEDGEFVLAYEEVGTFEVTIVADGYEDVTEIWVVEMDDDGCHPEPVSDTVELQAE